MYLTHINRGLGITEIVKGEYCNGVTDHCIDHKTFESRSSICRVYSLDQQAYYLTRPGIEPPTSQTQSERPNHSNNDNLVQLILRQWKTDCYHASRLKHREVRVVADVD